MPTRTGQPESGVGPPSGGEPGASSSAGAGAPIPSAGGRGVRFGEALVEQGSITQEQLNRALAEQRSAGRLLGETLVESGVISPSVLVQTLSRCLGIRGCHLRHGLLDPGLLGLLGEEEAARLKCIPMFRVHDELTVAMAEPQSLPTIDRLRRITGLRIRPVLALETEIRDFIKRYSGGEVNVDAFLTSLAESDVEVVDREAVDEEESTNLDRLVEGSPIVNLVNVALLTAVRDRASDIHIEPSKRGTRVRYRIDGVLRDLMRPPAGMHSAIVSRVKVIGRMDIAEKRLPQEGRVRIVAEGREIDLRVSSMPTLMGEKLVIRVLDKSNLKVRLEDLGFRAEAMATFKRMLDAPHGLLLVTGPTGSGKTTTLYSALDLLRSPEVNLVTVEDPVEYQLDLINQIQVSEAIGMSFARVLRSLLRQDPDVIMIGEIRDEETARVAVQAALTGHLVLATLHTNDSPSTIARLLDMNVEAYLLASALIGVVAQRLARTICPSCATRYYPSEQVLGDSGLMDRVGRAFRKGEGCQQCHDSGFQGRMGVYEVMEVNQAIRRGIHRAVPAHELREILRREGWRSLREEGVEAALAGKTTLEEVLRVTSEDEEADAKALPAPILAGDGGVPGSATPPGAPVGGSGIEQAPGRGVAARPELRGAA